LLHTAATMSHSSLLPCHHCHCHLCHHCWLQLIFIAATSILIKTEKNSGLMNA